MKIAVRMDDIAPEMDWTKFLRFQELCDQYQIKPLLGIVPANKDENLCVGKKNDMPANGFWEYVKELEKKGWSIAQHGVFHQYLTKKMGCFPLNRLSEFAGISYEQQYTMLKTGQDILRQHGIVPNLFMAPAHSFDYNTIKALKKLGFCGLTDGFGDRPYRRWGMVFYPISYRQSQSLKKTKGYTTFVVHTNTMQENDFARYRKIFEQHRDDIISYRELLKVQPYRRGFLGNLREYGMALVKFVLVNGMCVRKKSSVEKV